jgi:hypothetical protein
MPAATTYETVHEGARPARQAYPALLSRISWGAIFAGTLCALAVHLVLTFIGLSLGFSVVDPARDAQPLAGLGTATAAWWIISSLISLFAGGWVASRFAGIPRGLTGALHGATVWALVAILLTWFAAIGIMRAAGGATSALLQAAQTAGRTAETLLPENLPNLDISVQSLNSLIPGIDLESRLGVLQSYERQQQLRRDLREEARQIVRQVVSRQEQTAAGQAVRQGAQDVLTSPSDAGRDIERMLDRLFGGPNAVFNNEDKQELIKVVQTRLGLSPEEAQRIVQDWEQRYQAASNQLRQAWQEAQKQATQFAQASTDTLASISGWTAFALILGLGAALFGGYVGSAREVGVGSDED